jgi:hypothetical protein
LDSLYRVLCPPLVAGIPALAVVVSIIIDHRRFNRIDRLLDSIERITNGDTLTGSRR